MQAFFSVIGLEISVKLVSFEESVYHIQGMRPDISKEFYVNNDLKSQP